jgi:hypothetical protein
MMCRLINKFAFTEISNPVGLINRNGEKIYYLSKPRQIFENRKEATFHKVNLKTANSLDALHT